MTKPSELDILGADRIDYSFAEEVMHEPGGEHLFACSACGTCTATCLIRRIDPGFNPRLIIKKASLGLRQEVLGQREIWECSACDMCYSRCPKEIHISHIMRAMRNIAIREGYERPGVTAVVRVETCVACGRCVEACPYQAISLQSVTWNRREKNAACVDRNLCAGCGICNAACPSSSISVDGHTDAELYDSLVAVARVFRDISGVELKGKVLAIVCNWCLHAAFDARAALDPPEGVQVVRVPCAGRVSALLPLTALQRHADAVLIVGCREGECHYIHGNDLEEKRAALLGSFLDMLGVDQNRIKFVRVGSLDRGRFAGLLSEFGHVCEEVGV